MENPGNSRQYILIPSKTVRDPGIGIRVTNLVCQCMEAEWDEYLQKVERSPVAKCTSWDEELCSNTCASPHNSVFEILLSKAPCRCIYRIRSFKKCLIFHQISESA